MSNSHSTESIESPSTVEMKTTRKPFRPTYLYVKTHKVTGMKYFGKTVANDPVMYQGSGKRWKNHIRKHGYDCTTEIIGFFTNEEECKKAAIEFSMSNNIVDSDQWANLMNENGIDGGALVYTDEMKQRQRESSLKMMKKGTHPFLGDFQKNRVINGTHHLLGGEIQRKHASENNLKRVRNGTHHFVGGAVNRMMVEKGTHPFLGGKIQRETYKKRTTETKELLKSLREKMFIEGTHPTQVIKICPYCNKMENSALYARYHGDKCPMKDSTQTSFL